MTYTNIIPEAEQMTWSEAMELAEADGRRYSTERGYYKYALAKRIQMTEPKPVDPRKAAIDAGHEAWLAGSGELADMLLAELAKRGLKIGPVEGDER